MKGKRKQTGHVSYNKILDMNVFAKNRYHKTVEVRIFDSEFGDVISDLEFSIKTIKKTIEDLKNNTAILRSK